MEKSVYAGQKADISEIEMLFSAGEMQNGIQFTLDPILSVFHEKIYESIVGIISFGKNKNKKIIVGSAYRPGTPHPDMTMSELNDLFQLQWKEYPVSGSLPWSSIFL